jgi:type IV pilus assembly protein PilP
MKPTQLPFTQRKLTGLPLSCLFFLCLASGCSDNGLSDLNKYILEVKARPKGAIEKLPEVKMAEPFVFPAEILRDPFKALEEPEPVQNESIAMGNGLRPDFSRRKEELEAFPIDGLKMTGTIVMKAKLWGLVKASDKTIHRVQVGNYMGKNFGRIMRISTDKIELMEIVPDKPGAWREQQTDLALIQ